ncbi:MAG: hypothetical protein ACYSSI_08370 [Planctomycetota bacterium]|jgi:hypothetical protein
MTNEQIEEKRQQLIKIVNIPNSGKLIDWKDSGKKADTGQIERFKKLYQLALEVGASHISTAPQKTANEGELVIGIQAALQTALMLNASKAANKSAVTAIVSAVIAAISAFTALVAVVVN